MSLSRRESRADLSEVSLQLLDLSEWTLAAYGGFFREENIIVFGAPSILYVVRYAESNFSPGRLLTLSENLALVLALCKGRSKQFTLLSVMRRIFASGFRAEFVLSVRWVPSELNHSDEGSRLFDRDHDPSKSLLHVLAQRFTRTHMARINDKSCSLPPPMHLDIGQVGLGHHNSMPPVSVHHLVISRVSRDMRKLFLTNGLPFPKHMMASGISICNCLMVPSRTESHGVQ